MPEIKVLGLLVSGTETELLNFHRLVYQRLNRIDRRGDTVRCMCMSEDLEMAKVSARATGVTLEQINRDDVGESYEMIYQGTHAGWKAGLPR